MYISVYRKGEDKVMLFLLFDWGDYENIFRSSNTKMETEMEEQTVAKCSRDCQPGYRNTLVAEK